MDVCNQVPKGLSYHNLVRPEGTVLSQPVTSQRDSPITAQGGDESKKNKQRKVLSSKKKVLRLEDLDWFQIVVVRSRLKESAATAAEAATAATAAEAATAAAEAAATSTILTAGSAGKGKGRYRSDRGEEWNR